MPDIDWDDLPPTTLPPGISVSVQGFDNLEAAQLLGQTVGEIVALVGTVIDVSMLDGITIAADYDAALAALDRGIDGLRPLSRSNSDEMQGIAMSPAVMRDGIVKTHLAFDAERLAPLMAEQILGQTISIADKAHAVRIIAHECAHVQITARKERGIPDARFGTRIEGFERVVMFRLAEVAWDEYSVCRLSAPFARGQSRDLADTVIACADGARERADASIRAYRSHGDIERLVDEAGYELCQPMKAVAYLLGALDGAGIGWGEEPGAREALDRGGFGDLVNELHAILGSMWDTQDAWEPSWSVFAPLEVWAKKLFASGGIHFHTSPDGNCSIDVPFTAGTMP
ncbi:MAG: hypothetical protein EOO76_03045 [Novosphingobium sp.]|nr:MAG: hypothetical protein EOO76_03045 [Novosphingobium sp.]